MARTAFISGGSGAVGSALVRLFRSEGYNVAFTYKSREEKSDALCDETGASAFQADLTKKAEAKNAVGKALELFGSIDVLVNNAGRTQVMPFALIEEEDWDDMMDSNLKTMFLVTKEVVRGMINRKEGVIVNIGSLAGHRMMEVPVHYAAAKAGVMGFTLSLARELARFKIRVNSVVPGLLDDGVGRMVPEKELKEYVKYCAAGRPGKPEEVAQTVLFVASEKGSYINGQNIFVDGGL